MYQDINYMYMLILHIRTISIYYEDNYESHCNGVLSRLSTGAALLSTDSNRDTTQFS